MERAWHCRKCPGAFMTLSVTLWASTFCWSQGSGAQVSLAPTTCAVQCQGVSALQIAYHSEITWQRLCCITSYSLKSVLYSQMRSWWWRTWIYWLRKVENLIHREIINKGMEKVIKRKLISNNYSNFSSRNAKRLFVLHHCK